MSNEFNIYEIFEMAEQIERNGALFYRKSAESVTDPDGKKLLMELAEMEDIQTTTVTVTDDVAPLIKEFKAGRVEFRTDSSGNVHIPVGKVSFSKEALVENARAFLNYLATLRPSSVKGQFMQKVAMSSTMGPGIRIAF